MQNSATKALVAAEKANILPRWLLVPIKHGGTELSPGPKGTEHQGEQTGHGWSLRAYLGKRLYHCVQESSHPSGHFEQFQHYNENQNLISRAGKYFKQNP